MLTFILYLSYIAFYILIILMRVLMLAWKINYFCWNNIFIVILISLNIKRIHIYTFILLLIHWLILLIIDLLWAIILSHVILLLQILLIWIVKIYLSVLFMFVKIYLSRLFIFVKNVFMPLIVNLNRSRYFAIFSKLKNFIFL